MLRPQAKASTTEQYFWWRYYNAFKCRLPVFTQLAWCIQSEVVGNRLLWLWANSGWRSGPKNWQNAPGRITWVAHSPYSLQVRVATQTACFYLAFFAVSASLTNSAAADTVNWRQFEGTSITWAYDIHPYADALAAQLPEFEKLTRHQGHAGTLPRRFLLEQDDDPTDDEVASMGCVRHWHSARVGPRSEWRPGAAGQIPERSEAYRCWIRLHYVDMIKKCAAPSFANDNWYQVVDGISSGRTAMTIDSNMFGFWNDVAGKPASGKIAFAPPLHAPSATSLDSDIWIWALAMNAASEKKGTAWLFIPWATSKQVALKGALAGQLRQSAAHVDLAGRHLD